MIGFISSNQTLLEISSMLSISEISNMIEGYYRGRRDHLLQQYNSRQQKAIELLPLLFHTNINMMPGYIGKYMPSGISHFTPSREQIIAATRLSKYFHYDSDDQSNDNKSVKTDIASILIQDCFISGEKILWIIYQENLEKNEIQLLNKKASNLVKWLQRQGIEFTSIVSSENEIAYHYYSSHNYDYHIDKCFFLDNFYAESILLAGKPFSWWFSGDFCEGTELENDNVINCGELIRPGYRDYTSAAIWYLYSIFNQPVNSYLNLSLIDHFISNGSHHFFSKRLKNRIMSSQKPEEIDTHEMYQNYLDNMISNHVKPYLNALQGRVRTTPGSSKPAKSPRHYPKGTPRIATDFIKHSASICNIYAAAENSFRRIKICLNLRGFNQSQLSPTLSSISCGLLSRLYNTGNKIPITNHSDVFLLDRVSYKHNSTDNEESWSLMYNDMPVHTNNNLITLTCWAFVNRLIDTSTQISIQQPEYNIRQIDILEIIKTLGRNIEIDQLLKRDINNFIDEPIPVKSLLFIGHSTDNFKQRMIDHIIIYNTGEVYSHKYNDIQHFYSWHKSYPNQHIIAYLYGSWANKYREIDRKTLKLIDNVSVY